MLLSPDSPSGVVVNGEMGVLWFRGGTSNILTAVTTVDKQSTGKSGPAESQQNSQEMAPLREEEWIRPYRTADHKIDGAVSALADINGLKDAPAEAAKAKKPSAEA